MHTIRKTTERTVLGGTDTSFICPVCNKLYHLGKVDVTLDISNEGLPAELESGRINFNSAEYCINSNGVLPHAQGGPFATPACWSRADTLLSVRCKFCNTECIEVETDWAPLVHALNHFGFYVKEAFTRTPNENGNEVAEIRFLFTYAPYFLLNAMVDKVLHAERFVIKKYFNYVPTTNSIVCSTPVGCPNIRREYIKLMAESLMHPNNAYRAYLICYSNVIKGSVRNWMGAFDLTSIFMVGRDASFVANNNPALFYQIEPFFRWLASRQAEVVKPEDLRAKAMEAVSTDYANRGACRSDDPDPTEPCDWIPSKWIKADT